MVRVYMSIDNNEGNAIPRPLLGLLRKCTIRRRRTNTTVTRIIGASILRPMLNRRPVGILHRRIQTSRLTFLVNTSRVRVLDTMTLLRRLTMGLLLFLLLRGFFFRDQSRQRNTTTNLILRRVTSREGMLTIRRLFHRLIVSNSKLTLGISEQPLRPRCLTTTRTVMNHGRSTRIRKIVLQCFRRLLSFVLKMRVKPRTILLQTIGFRRQINFRVILTSNVLRHFARSNRMISGNINNTTVRRSLLLGLIRCLQHSLTRLRTR